MGTPVIQEIAFAGSGPWFTQNVALGGITYELEFQFNERIGLWYLSIFDSAHTPIVQGIALVSGRDLLQPYRTKLFPTSVLFVYDTTGQKTDPGYSSFGVTHRLLFSEVS